MTVRTSIWTETHRRKNPQTRDCGVVHELIMTKISGRYPIDEKLYQYAQWWLLCTYLKDRKVPLLWFLLRNREMIETEVAVEKVAALQSRLVIGGMCRLGRVELEAAEAVRAEEAYAMDAELGALWRSPGDLARTMQAVDRSRSGRGIQTTRFRAKALSLSGCVPPAISFRRILLRLMSIRRAQTGCVRLVTPGLEVSATMIGLGFFQRNASGMALAVPFHLTCWQGFAARRNSAGGWSRGKNHRTLL